MQGDRQRGVLRTAAGLAFAALCLACPLAARAQVLEIGDGGAVTVHDRPEVILATGATPIAQARSPAAVRPVHRPSRRPATEPAAPDVTEASDAAALSPALVEAVAWQESRLHTLALSPRGAVGEMQLMPVTARRLGVDPYDARQNLAGGAAYLGALMRRYDGDLVRTLAAYNAGPGAVDRYGGLPPYKETQAYVSAILERLSRRAEAR